MRVHVEDNGLCFYGLFVTGGNVWWHAVPSVKEGAAVSSRSFVLKCMCLSVCVPICCWLNFMWIICSIILNISWFYSSYHLYFLCFSAVLQYFYMFACHFIMVCFICLYMFLSICLYIVSDDEIKMIKNQSINQSWTQLYFAAKHGENILWATASMEFSAHLPHLEHWHEIFRENIHKDNREWSCYKLSVDRS